LKYEGFLHWKCGVTVSNLIKAGSPWFLVMNCEWSPVGNICWFSTTMIYQLASIWSRETMKITSNLVQPRFVFSLALLKVNTFYCQIPNSREQLRWYDQPSRTPRTDAAHTATNWRTTRKRQVR
jgi:hypothetical protein